MTGMALSQLLEAAGGYTIIPACELIVHRPSWTMDLRLRLESTATSGAHEVETLFEEVSGLSLRQFGGGLTQLLALKVEEVSGDQLERVKYRVGELEREALLLSCRGIRVDATVA
jgi:hypothetical protein